MNRMTIVQCSAVLLAAGLLFGCKMNPRSATPSGADRFLTEIVEELGTLGEACEVINGVEMCVSTNSRALIPGDRVDQTLLLCSRIEGELSDCKDLRSDPNLDVQYICSNGMCYCEGIASCALMATSCGPAGGACGECAVGDCCCLDPDVDMPN